jgi:hypothetical protein
MCSSCKDESHVISAVESRLINGPDQIKSRRQGKEQATDFEDCPLHWARNIMQAWHKNSADGETIGKIMSVRTEGPHPHFEKTRFSCGSTLVGNFCSFFSCISSFSLLVLPTMGDLNAHREVHRYILPAGLPYHYCSPPSSQIRYRWIVDY